MLRPTLQEAEVSPNNGGLAGIVIVTIKVFAALNCYAQFMRFWAWYAMPWCITQPEPHEKRAFGEVIQKNEFVACKQRTLSRAWQPYCASITCCHSDLHLRWKCPLYNSAGMTCAVNIIAAPSFFCFGGSKLEQAIGEHWWNVQGLPCSMRLCAKHLCMKENNTYRFSWQSCKAESLTRMSRVSWNQCSKSTWEGRLVQRCSIFQRF